MEAKFRIVSSRLGYVGLLASPRGLGRVYLPRRSRATLRRVIKHDFDGAGEDNGLLPELADSLRRYFDGERVEFDARLDCDEAGEFERHVWQACRKVRYAQTVSYKELAARAGRPDAARAVGTALSRNPFPIVVPCHRVVKSDGSLGGYFGPGGVGLKRRLLEMETAPRGC